MKQETPFASLGRISKHASDLFNINTGNPIADGIANIGVEVGAGTNPFTGIPFYGSRMVDDFKNGKIWSGIGNGLWGAASLVGGTALAKGALGAGKMALKSAPVAGRLATIANGAGKAAPTAQRAIAAGTALNTAGKATKQFAGRQLDNLSKGVANTAIPFTGRTLGTGVGNTVANGVKYTAGQSIIPTNSISKTVAPTVAAAPAVAAAPNWYTAVTGNSTLPKFAALQH